MTAEFRFAAAAIVSKKVDQPTKPGDIGAIADCSTVLLSDDETSAGENGQVVRHRVVRHVAVPRDFAGEKAVRIDRQQPPQGLQPRGLSQGANPSMAVSVKLA